jgi:hypothetical protein
MAKKKVVRTTTVTTSRPAQSTRPSVRSRKHAVIWNFPLDKKDFIFLAIGLGTIILGYIFMATGLTEDPALVEGTWNNPLAITIAPLLLVIGYCVVIPLALLKMFSKKKNEQDA